VVPLYGHLSGVFNGGMYPPGLSLRAEFLPVKGDWGSLGAGAFIFWNYLAVTKTDPKAGVQLFDFQLNLLYRYALSPRLVLGLDLGGPVLVHALSYDIGGAGQEPLSTWILSLDGGASLRWLFNPRGFAELGFSYVNLFSVGGPQGFLLPFIGAGWKF
jgi:hypothetical protein